MKSKAQYAAELFRSGHPCSQSVLTAFCENYGLNRDCALKISCGFCSGVRSAEVCGAVSGAVMVIGLKHGCTDARDRTAKQTCDAKVEEFIRAFRQQNRSVVCRDILGCDICTPEGKKKAQDEKLFTTVCVDKVVSAVSLLEALGY